MPTLRKKKTRLFDIADIATGKKRTVYAYTPQIVMERPRKKKGKYVLGWRLD